MAAERGTSGGCCIAEGVPLAPSMNHLYATVDGHRVKSKEGRMYAENVARIARAVGILCYHGPVKVTTRIFRPQKRGDLENYLKAQNDALNGIAWLDDEQICETHNYRYEDKKTRVRN